MAQQENKKKFLIIDDDPELSQGLVELFTDEGYSVDTSLNGLDGLNLLKQYEYNIVFLDIRMPGLNGIELLKQLRGFPVKCKIFIISGAPDTELRLESEGIMQMVKGIIKKPFEINSMLEMIRNIANS